MIGKDDDNLINTDDASHVVSIETNERRTSVNRRSVTSEYLELDTFAPSHNATSESLGTQNTRLSYIPSLHSITRWLNAI